MLSQFIDFATSMFLLFFYMAFQYTVTYCRMMRSHSQLQTELLNFSFAWLTGIVIGAASASRPSSCLCQVTSCRQEFHNRCVLEWRKLEVKWSTRVI
ncbi:hypothetical protein SORBI_3001G266700 [Sorghum bicolor]|uniref:Uncharacterized protein n=1 Tax=Sorghum bicolor TaxID=4558 RepID=A0A1B6QL75_SORBI|nr:hypothetical protein SORBI_3001G266700 [Sorghum bicolor]